MHSTYDRSPSRFRRRLALVWLTLLAGLWSGSSLQADEPPAAGVADSPFNEVDPNALTENSPFGVNQALVTQQEFTEFRREQTKYLNALRAAEPKSPTITLVKAGLRVRVLSLSIPEFRSSMDVIRKSFMRELKYVGSKQTNPRLRQQFREIVLDEIILHCRTLLKNHLQVRLQAVTLLCELNAVEENRIEGTVTQPYDKSITPLRDIITDAEQHLSVKIVALSGIRRLVMDKTLNYSGNDQLETSQVLVNALKPNDTHYWYQYALAQTLAHSKVAADRNGKPFIVQALAEVMADAKRDPRVRCAAAFSVGRVPLSNTVNLNALSYQVAALTREMVVLYNADPRAVHWNMSFFDLYASFQAINQQEQTDKKGLVLQAQTEVFSQFKEKVNGAFGQVAPVVDKVFVNRARVEIPAAVTAPLINWLTQNNPGEIVVYPGARPISLAPAPMTTTTVTGR